MDIPQDPNNKRKLKWDMCLCEINGLVRPPGPVQIKSTEMKSPDVLVATLRGAVTCQVATVRVGEKYYFVGPESLGGRREVPADSLTDGLHAAIYEENIKRTARKAQRA